MDTSRFYVLAGCFCMAILLFACRPADSGETSSILEKSQDGPIISGPGIVQDEFRIALLEKWKAIKPPLIEAQKLPSQTWMYGEGNPKNGLHATVAHRPKLDTSVTLPHRVLKPDWPLWYEREIRLKGSDWLYVDADDGAQVFQNGRLLTPTFGEFFSLLPGEEGSTEEASILTIRVLNNAMHGGLEDVRTVDGSAFQQYKKYREQRVQMQKILFEALHAVDLSASQKEAIKEMLEHPSDKTIALAKALYNQSIRYPYLPTLPDTGENDGVFSFTAWGDSQAGWDTFQQLVSQMAEIPVAFSIGLGDLVGFGSKEEEWLAFTVALQPLLKKQAVFPVPGNHDYDGYYNDLVPELYYRYTRQQNTTQSYFSWTNEGAFFLALDPNRNFPLDFEEEQLQWMLAEMDSEAWRQANWRFILLHQLPYGQGWPGYHGDLFIRELIDSLATPKKIDFVLTGHNHDYERLTLSYGSQKTHFFVLGGAGGGLEPEESSSYPEMDRVIKQHHFARFDIEPRRVEVSIIGLNGQILDEVKIDK